MSTFPPLVPFATGHLPVDGVQTLYWEASGNPEGKPAVYLHGGPGSGIMTGYRRHFDPEIHLIVSFEQRGCGRSRPLVNEPGHDLAANTTQSLIGDMEALRRHLGVERWLVYGASWGTTLALAYAQAYPERVSEMVLACVTTTSRSEVAWITEGMRAIFPREWERFAEAAAPAAGQSLIAAYYARILDHDPQVRTDAARAWCAWEDVHVSLAPGHRPYARFEDPEFRLLFATLVIHYWAHAGFMDEPGLLGRVDRIAHIPAVLIHGRYDVSSPLEVAWKLHRAWPASEFIVIEDEGHGGEKMVQEVTRAIARWPSSAS
jgi:proline iminopeptidase